MHSAPSVAPAGLSVQPGPPSDRSVDPASPGRVVHAYRTSTADDVRAAVAGAGRSGHQGVAQQGLGEQIGDGDGVRRGSVPVQRFVW